MQQSGVPVDTGDTGAIVTVAGSHTGDSGAVPAAGVGLAVVAGVKRVGIAAVAIVGAGVIARLIGRDEIVAESGDRSGLKLRVFRQHASVYDGNYRTLRTRGNVPGTRCAQAEIALVQVTLISRFAEVVLVQRIVGHHQRKALVVDGYFVDIGVVAEL